ncbi:expressed unknown protein [Seminavis robusta]|uniref:TFIIS N-terminal domain-containing protein n=1 Tax=Seminavis robusta TaxID=568900 RepID=A0A9N8HX82_9STRA|nr:expressed unknown protein [Seminavis robusta]|eukprot:Sro2383_g325630.1 n/a (476) ;mRNA; f:6504-7931
MSSEDLKPAADDAVAVSSKKQRFVQADTRNKASLFARCQAVVVANLERYPPEIFGMLSPDDWEDILRIKHGKTAPQKGTGGLDGTGRRTPALSERFIGEVERMNDHLAESDIADELVWKDCVEYQFSRRGLTRPRAMLFPWPVLVQHLAEQANILVQWKKKEDVAERNEEPLSLTPEDTKAIVDATQKLKESAMNVSLLKESGVGKVLKKLIKAETSRADASIFDQIKMPSTVVSSLVASKDTGKPKNQMSVLRTLENLLQAWMDFAASRGVDMNAGKGNKESAKAMELFKQDAEDLECTEQCKTWRHLFASLKGRADQRRLNLGQKMRENRKNQNSVRPQIVKVRPANSRRERILHKGASTPNWGRGGGTVGSHGGAKILELRKEASVQAERQKAGVVAYKKKGSGFGAAVALASTNKLTAKQKMIQMESRKRKIAAIVGLGSGKQMAVPQKAMRMQGGNFSSKKAKRSQQGRK